MASIASGNLLDFNVTKDLILDYLTVTNGLDTQRPLRQYNNLSDLSNVQVAQLNLGVVQTASAVVVTQDVTPFRLNYTGGVLTIDGASATVTAGFLTVPANVAYGAVFALSNGAGVGTVSSGLMFPPTCFPLAIFTSGAVNVTSLSTANAPSYQPFNARLDSLSTITPDGGSGGEALLYFASNTTLASSSSTALGRGLLQSASVGAMQSYIQIQPGVNVQAQSALLQSIVNTNPASGFMFYTTGTNQVSLSAVSKYGLGLLLPSNSATPVTGPPYSSYSSIQSYLGLTIGVDIQAHSVSLDAIAAAPYAGAGEMLYTVTGVGPTQFGLVTGTQPFGRSLLTQSTAAATRTTTGTALRLRTQLFVNAANVTASWSETDYIVDNSANAVTVTFPSPGAGETGNYSTVWVTSDPSAGVNNVTIRSNAAATGHYINSVQFNTNLRAIFSYALTYPSNGWFEIRVQAVALQRIAVGSAEHFDVLAS